MTGWKDDGEYWTKKATIHHKSGGKYIVSVRKETINVLKFNSTSHDQTDNRGGA